eukprot:scaffold2319_cov248-Pinguiococcus_pyrenoidosus.AAC.11
MLGHAEARIGNRHEVRTVVLSAQPILRRERGLAGEGRGEEVLLEGLGVPPRDAEAQGLHRAARQLEDAHDLVREHIVRELRKKRASAALIAEGEVRQSVQFTPLHLKNLHPGVSPSRHGEHPRVRIKNREHRASVGIEPHLHHGRLEVPAVPKPKLPIPRKGEPGGDQVGGVSGPKRFHVAAVLVRLHLAGQVFAARVDDPQHHILGARHERLPAVAPGHGLDLCLEEGVLQRAHRLRRFQVPDLDHFGRRRGENVVGREVRRQHAESALVSRIQGALEVVEVLAEALFRKLPDLDHSIFGGGEEASLLERIEGDGRDLPGARLDQRHLVRRGTDRHVILASAAQGKHAHRVAIGRAVCMREEVVAAR